MKDSVNDRVQRRMRDHPSDKHYVELDRSLHCR